MICMYEFDLFTLTLSFTRRKNHRMVRGCSVCLGQLTTRYARRVSPSHKCSPRSQFFRLTPLFKTLNCGGIAHKSYDTFLYYSLSEISSLSPSSSSSILSAFFDDVHFLIYEERPFLCHLLIFSPDLVYVFSSSSLRYNLFIHFTLYTSLLSCFFSPPPPKPCNRLGLRSCDESASSH